MKAYTKNPDVGSIAFAADMVARFLYNHKMMMFTDKDFPRLNRDRAAINRLRAWANAYR